jgi:L-alanine-DL-glutamate epimerase-like enolase superfamily enzyme
LYEIIAGSHTPLRQKVHVSGGSFAIAAGRSIARPLVEIGSAAQAIAAIENACLDIKAKALGIPSKMASAE